MAELSELVAEQRSRLLGLAYRMLGSRADAEDAVQEAFLRLAGSDLPTLADPAAWLTTVVTRICLDRLRSAQHRREAYVGEWLPEPVATDLDPADMAGTADSLTFAFLLVLESLSALERAAFLLHDVFGHPFEEVAVMLDRSPVSVRQLASRARAHIAARPARRPADPAVARAVTEAFLAACEGEDLKAMLDLLAPDVVFVGDGGGLATAVPVPVEGSHKVAHMLAGFWRVGRRRGAEVSLREVNAEPGVCIRMAGTTESVLVVEVTGQVITAIRAVRNPEKLTGFDGATP